MAISSASIQKLLILLRPYLRDENERRAYLLRALGMNAPVLNRLILNTSVDVFITNMVNELVAFGDIAPGQPALCVLLEVIREDVGIDVKDSIDQLLQKIREELQKAEITCNSVQTTDALIEQVEQLLSNPNGYIYLEKLVVREAKALAEVMQGELEACPWVLYPNNPTQCQQCFDYLEVKSERLVRTLITIIHYGRNEEFVEVIEKAFRILTKTPSPRSFEDTGVYIRLYPLALAIYAVFIIGIHDEKPRFLRTLLNVPFNWIVYRENSRIILALFCLFNLTGIMPISIIQRIKYILLSWINVDELSEDANVTFWQVELVLGLACIELTGQFLLPGIYLFGEEEGGDFVLKSFLCQKSSFLRELYQNVENILEAFDNQAEQFLKRKFPLLPRFPGGFRRGALPAFRGEVWY
jgi:hypothetical protein